MGLKHFFHITQFFNLKLAPILDAILNISKCSMMPEWHHSELSRRIYALPESTKKKTLKSSSRSSLNSPEFCQTILIFHPFKQYLELQCRSFKAVLNIFLPFPPEPRLIKYPNIARPLGLHHNHYVSPSTRPLSVSENAHMLTTWCILITYCIHMHANIL